MNQQYCSVCGHKLQNADERGVAGFSNKDNHIRFSCARIDCMNVILEGGYWFFGIAKGGQDLSIKAEQDGA